MTNDSTSRSWFCVFNNPEEHGFEGFGPEAVINAMKTAWMDAHPGGACELTYCVSAEGLPHVHAVFESEQPVRFSSVRKMFSGMHVEPTKGTKAEAEDYINKVGKYAEKGEEVLCRTSQGEIKGRQGKRSVLDEADAMIAAGMTPAEIFAESVRYRRYSSEIREAYIEKLRAEMPDEKDMRVYYHVGESGSGKSYTQIGLKKEPGGLYLLTDYGNGGFDKYAGERILFMDEFRGQMDYNILLMALDKYVVQLHARYSNVYSLWTEVHMASVLPPEDVYRKMVQSDRGRDTMLQMMRRITAVRYHALQEGQYLTYDKPGLEYTTYNELVLEAVQAWSQG